jgi:hypothetical protein
MSYVAKTYEFIGKLEGLFNKKMFKITFVMISSMLLFFGVMNIYAQAGNSTSASLEEIESTRVKVNWKGMKNFINLANGLGVKGQDEDNTGTNTMINIASVSSTALAIMAPEITEGADDILSSTTVPDDMKGGVLGMVDKGLTYAYVNYPSINIGSHLAEEWVPGYDSSKVSTYAADGLTSGYDTLKNSGITSLWSAVRNLSYVFFVIVMITVGFMIMFRSKIGGQTLVTLGNFLPGVITSLILITFSFAIAGLLIDIGGLIVSLFAGIYGVDNVRGINSLWTLMTSALAGGTGWSALGTGAIGTGILAFTAKAVLVALAGGRITAGVVAGGAGILLILIALLVVGIVFVGGVKVLITLYKAFFGILLGVVIAPIQLMIGAFPGKGYVSTNWFKSLLRNVLTFPLVFAIVNFPTYLANQGDIKLFLPEKLSYASTDGMDINIGWLVFSLVRIVSLYYAAEAPKYLGDWLPGNTGKSMGEGLASAKASLSKIPLVGDLFK